MIKQLIFGCFLTRARTICSVIAHVSKILLLVFLTIYFKEKFLKPNGYNLVPQYNKQNHPGRCQLTQNLTVSSTVM